MSLFEDIKLQPPDPIFGLIKRFESDPNPNKINLVPGVYYDETLKQRKMRAIYEAEKRLLTVEKNKNYLPILGSSSFLKNIEELIFGNIKSEHVLNIYGAQTLGGTGALSIGGHFAFQTFSKTAYISSPTWANHIKIFKECGMEVFSYPYYCAKTHQLDFEGMIHSFKKAPKNSLIILQPCGHNPTGCDLSRNQWKEISSLFLDRKLVAFFDLAYMGLAVGIEEDVWPLNYFASKGHEFLAAVSCSKSFGLYGERTGALFITSKKRTKGVSSLLQTLIRSTYSNPSRHGAKLIALVLEDPNLKQEWKRELSHMQKRIQMMRENLLKALKASMGKNTFDFLKNRSGMFSFLDLSKHHVEELIDRFGIYLTEDGRINLAALNDINLKTLAIAITKTVQ